MKQSPSCEAVTQLAKRFPTFYGSRNFITVFTRAPPLVFPMIP